MNRKIYLSSPCMCGKEQEYVKEAFDTNWVAPLGKNVNEFENALKEYVGVNGAVAMSAGTAAIHMALRVADVGSGGVVRTMLSLLRMRQKVLVVNIKEIN